MLAYLVCCWSCKNLKSFLNVSWWQKVWMVWTRYEPQWHKKPGEPNRSELNLIQCHTIKCREGLRRAHSSTPSMPTGRKSQHTCREAHTHRQKKKKRCFTITVESKISFLIRWKISCQRCHHTSALLPLLPLAKTSHKGFLWKSVPTLIASADTDEERQREQ